MRIWRCSICPPTVPPRTGLSPSLPARRGIVERVIARDRLIVALLLVTLTALAWWWLWGRPMPDHQAEGGMAGMAGMAPASPAVAVWTPDYLLSAFLMWMIMMVAMMLPSASPMILLYARFASRSNGGSVFPTSLFALTYLALWGLFSILAVIVQAMLISSGLISQMDLALSHGRLAGILLLAAGAYQLTPAKSACLRQCRSPLSFLMRLWRPGLAGALRLGIAHGGYCIGCCALLMLLLFVGGVMNLGWVAALASLVLIEKYSPPWMHISTVIACGLIAAGILLLLGYA